MATVALHPNNSQESIHRGTIVGVMIFGAFVAILNQTLLNVAIPHLMTAFNVTADTVQWLSTAYMLTNGITIPITAFLIGTFTTRGLFLTSLTFFTLGSFICSIAPTFTIMLIGRIVQAAGAGIMMPLMMTVILNIYPPDIRGKAMGTVGIAMFFAPAVGPTLSGWMIEHYSWRLLFWVVIPIAILDMILAAALLKNVTERTKPKFDAWGFVTSTIGFGSLLYGFSEAGSKGWQSGVVLATIVVGLIFIALFAIHELTAKNPMLNLRVFKYGMFTLAAAVSSVVNMAMFGGALLVPIYIQNIRGYTPLESGLLLLPGAILMGIMSPISGALLDRYGIRPLAVIGLLITSVTTWQFAHLNMYTNYSHVMLLYTMRMFGMSFIAMTIMTSGLNHLPRHLNSHGTASANTVRMVAASLGTAFLITVMSNRSNYHIAQYGNTMTLSNAVPAQFLQDTAQSLAALLGQPLSVGYAAAVQILSGLTQAHATVNGIDDAFVVATALAVVALVLSFFLRKRVVLREPGPTRQPVVIVDEGPRTPKLLPKSTVK
ncbi:DHA2 family efflux MFS transporter permease subunit [Alicyclobacillus tolerans]|uniref:DHA2 family efflux MFS transporter permease subunit n=1 Tax=Alicyclobacillus tolerans TaxID=90970 RepID=UPI001F024B77|nr:DHA2 family efflux MFS transporter permease subunit [Alicyclobacillus tolerans]MCF8566494.1 DHA2 family efflux MFS transporter permease subunit [Alicyclobacillus tolerans]